MFRIRTYNQISSKGLDRFPRDRYQVGPDTEAPEGYILRSHKLHGQAIPDSLLGVARAGAGVNNIPVAEYSACGVVVFNTPGANANAVKELVLTGMLLASRDIFAGMNYVQGLTDITEDAAMAALLEKEKSRFAGCEIQGRTLGVVGLGAIGAIVANMALELGMKVVGYDPALSVEAAWRLSSSVEKMDSLQSLLARADYVTLHVPALPSTRHMINADTLRSLKPGAVLLNFAREEIIDTPAVIAALDSGQLDRFVTDFPIPALLGRPDVIAMPHLGASTAEAEENCAVMAADQLMDFLEHGNIRNSVNFPTTRMVRNGGYRLTFANANVPKVLGKVLAVIADCNNNVIDLVNQSRDDLAYNIIDVDQPIDQCTLDQITAIEGVIRVRAL
ncbi:MAG: 3-phosphoglycerate dehydrogenase [Porticoccaceae bacterium]|jgi:D-3-phosphoglycerate dehydrogenase|nr:3-phosphoglycerate dehydrogenase [Porticoccaceae bacterium]